MNKIVLLAVWCAVMVCGCRNGSHFINDRAYREMVERDFENKRQILASAPENLFAVFDKTLLPEEREALMFLYAYSPLVDLTVSGGDFLLENVRLSLKVREEMPWGKEIPEDIFRHFVLPVRGGNESLDSARMVFYKELRDRVIRCRTMGEAALEVNHWCHEKAIYMPTNARTCPPLAMLSTAYGRCGEESIFALAALRSVGIPARQVYTPRWAHCDDNHAWIEVWADGTWKYLGACEPEPRLDMAWFTAPVRRGLLIQARVFGKYISDEEVVSVNPNLTNVNSTPNYTKTRKVRVEVTDTAGQPVADAKVEYKIYNYGEYYPAVTLKTDASGLSALSVGLGDWMIWAGKAGRYGFRKLDALHMDSDTLRIVLDKAGNESYQMEFDLVPPAEAAYQAVATDRERAENDRRFMYEDSVRNAYVATFMSGENARQLAQELEVNADLFGKYIKESRGNYAEIVSFIRNAPSGNRPAAMELLGVIPGKDLQDTPSGVLASHLEGAVRFKDAPVFPAYLTAGYKYGTLFKEYILNPRVKNEQLTAWRQPLEKYMAGENIRSVEELLGAMGKIRVVDSVNTVGIETPPAGVLRAMVTDTRSKELFFVAACRTMGVAARLNPVNGKPEYHTGTDWKPVRFVAEGNSIPKGGLMLRYSGTAVKDPAYYTHFTISKIEDGTARSIDLGSNTQVDMGGGASYRTIFADPVALEEGNYILTTGNRKSDGSVCSVVKAFTVKAGELATVDMLVRDAQEDVKVLGTVDTKVAFVLENGGKACPLILPEKGYTALALIAANKEPTNHLVRDMSAMKEDFERLGVPLMFLFADQTDYQKFSRHDFRPLPAVMKLGYDADRTVATMLEKRLNLQNADNLPLIVMLNKKGEVVFLSQGYRIGLGTQIMKVMNYK